MAMAMIKNSKILALKYRPKTFDDLIGQDVIVETIRNSIRQIKFQMLICLLG